MRNVIGLIGTLAMLALVSALGISDELTRWLTDLHWRGAAAYAPEPFAGITVVAIDDKTLASRDPVTGKRFGRTGDWSRERHARLLANLGRARAVGFDILFLDEGRDPEGDAAFAAATARHGRVVLAYSLFGGNRTIDNQDQQRIASLLDRAGVPAEAPAREWPRLREINLQPPLPALMQASAGLGLVEVAADPDGVHRRSVPLWWCGGRRVMLPSLPLSLACVATGSSREALLPAADQLRLGRRDLALHRGELWLQPLARRPTVHGPGQPVRLVSYCDALRADPETFRDQIVLVGETATGTGDVRPNPLDPGLRGVEFNAEVLANLLHVAPVKKLSAGGNLLLILLAIGLPLWLFRAAAPRLAMGLSTLAAVVLLGLMEVLFWAARTVPAWAPVLVGAASATLIMGLLRLVEEERAKRQIRRSFGMYVAPEVVAMIADDPAIANQQGARQAMAVLFSDVRSFTSYCEQNPPELVVAQMREYLAEMTLSVDNYHGVLDKFVGDAVMALYGPFLEPDANACALAVASALDMLTRLDALNARWAESGWPQLKIGIGIHYGQAILGNIGSERKMQYTALGDTVNTASRLESMTKELGTLLLVSEEARALAEPVLGGLVEFRPLGEITVRNRATPVTVFAASRRSAEPSSS
ncbi:MAG: adenylate/guanylate cyclase domain-containing protein [Armatimonadetes bacterium]|nr:adenylate/guanylate cyclase domain-containing protein [Armatimonadota bacterium]